MSIALIVAADEPALFYSSIESAECDLEAVDVEEGVYTAVFGPQGEEYDVIPDEGRVRIVRKPNKSENPEGLKKVLLSFLSAVNIDVNENEDVSGLLDKCQPYIQ